MGLMPGPKQTFTVDVGTGPTDIGFVKNTMGARALKVRAHSGPNGNALTLQGAMSHDGVNNQGNPYGAVLIYPGTGVTNGAGGANWIIQATGADGATIVEITSNYVRLNGSFATAGGVVTVDVWPLYDMSNPAFRYGRNAE